jgi:hypothetical protein
VIHRVVAVLEEQQGWRDGPDSVYSGNFAIFWFGGTKMGADDMGNCRWCGKRIMNGDYCSQKCRHEHSESL